MNKRAKRTNKNTGFGLQKGLSLEDGALVFLRITNSRRLNMEALGKTLSYLFKGGFQTLILDQGKGLVKKMNLLEFLGMLQASFIQKRLLFLESKCSRDLRGYGH
ncbi:hypothetical protein ACFWNC_14710 [Streptomyces sp. NPDC058369]|uniref:hypothetical protein n=1 Tax=Streptomyces sp. NPDC058369 TaxID=3346462 RepID=UPI00364953F7